MTSSDESSGDMLSKIQKDLSSGLLYTRSHINNTSKTLESTSFLWTLIELLIEKKPLTTEELMNSKDRLQKSLLRDSNDYFFVF